MCFIFFLLCSDSARKVSWNSHSLSLNHMPAMAIVQPFCFQALRHTRTHIHTHPLPPDLQLLISQPKDICIHATAFQQSSASDSNFQMPQLLICTERQWRRLCPYLSSERFCFSIILNHTILEALVRNGTIYEKPSSVSSLLCSYIFSPFLPKEIYYCVY